MQLTKTLPLLILSMALWGCSSISVNSDYDSSTNFEALQTFSWVAEVEQAPEDARQGNSLVTARIEEAVVRSLSAKGYRRVDANPDFQVGYSVSTRRGIDVNSSPSMGVSYGRRGAYGGMGVSASTTDVREYTEGTLMIDMVDPGANQLIWRGTGQSRISESKTPEERTQNINEAVEKILAQFPPEKK